MGLAMFSASWSGEKVMRSIEEMGDDDDGDDVVASGVSGEWINVKA